MRRWKRLRSVSFAGRPSPAALRTLSPTVHLGAVLTLSRVDRAVVPTRAYRAFHPGDGCRAVAHTKRFRPSSLPNAGCTVCLKRININVYWCTPKRDTWLLSRFNQTWHTSLVPPCGRRTESGSLAWVDRWSGFLIRTREGGTFVQQPVRPGRADRHAVQRT